MVWAPPNADWCGKILVDVRTQRATRKLVPSAMRCPTVEVRLLDERGHVPTDSLRRARRRQPIPGEGLLAEPGLTRQRFVDLGDGVRRYRTGDLGRLQQTDALSIWVESITESESRESLSTLLRSKDC